MYEIDKRFEMNYTLQVLISTMHQTDYSLLDKMNIQSDAIIVNQCDKNEINEFEYKGHQIKWISLAERGVGLSRNTALMRATADILLFADDDVVYEDGYADMVRSEFLSNGNIDLITFNLRSLNEKRSEFLDVRNHRLHWYNSLKYGASRISIKRESALKHNLFYSLLFGGGAPHQAGEDNLFITEALHKGLKVMASKTMIGTVAQEESTWFKGYDEKYYFDRGFLFANMYGKLANFLLFILELKEKHCKSKMTIFQRLRIEKKGIKEYRS